MIDVTWELTIENIAGIRSGNAVLEPGINAVRGTNWQGKSSFVTAVKTVLVAETVLTEGTERGRVTLATDEDTYRVELCRENGAVQWQGMTYLSAEKARVAASLYAFLDETNEVRNAVRNHENLEAVLTRPLDFENIDEQIEELARERSQVEDELAQAERAAQKLPTVEETIQDLKRELAELDEQRESMRGEESVSEHREELSDLKVERDSVQQRIERLESSVERTRERRAEKQETLETLDVPEPDEDFSAGITAHRERMNEFERDAELLQSIYGPIKRIIDEDRLDLVTDVERDLIDDHLSCWVCGSETTREAVETQLHALSDRISELRDRAKEHRQQVETLRERRETTERVRRQESTLREDIAALESTLEDRQASLESARERRKQLEEQIEELSEMVEERDADLTDVESDIKYTETRLEERRRERDDLESRARRRDHLEATRTDLTDEIAGLRDRKSNIKKRARDAFESAIRDILRRFDVGFEMVRLTSTFDLVVARDGKETDLSALSEGERELIGIIAALAGYEAFDVTDEVPVLLLDGVGGLADDNLKTLVEYLEPRAEYLVFTTYPENTVFEANTIDPREWNVVSHETESIV